MPFYGSLFQQFKSRHNIRYDIIHIQQSFWSLKRKRCRWTIASDTEQRIYSRPAHALCSSLCLRTIHAIKSCDLFVFREGTDLAVQADWAEFDTIGRTIKGHSRTTVWHKIVASHDLRDLCKSSKEWRLVGVSDDGGAELADAVLHLRQAMLLRSLRGMTDMLVEGGDW